MTKKIDYYGYKDNYIHLKFGDCVKAFNFTDDFMHKYPLFVRAYKLYWDGERTVFANPFQVVSYVFNNDIPVHFYYNFTDTPAKSRKEITEYLLRENNKSEIYDWELPLNETDHG